ncbi:MAG: sialidase, partial [Gemmatimonadetes bacterium]|nr:sialidase [Gemmatimonadota bacterium]
MNPPPGSAQEVPTSSFASMQYRHIGPLGNRITSVAGVPGDRFTYYVGAASGGLWKTEDGGVNWRAVFDDQPVHSVGEVEVSPSDPNIVWAGTGEPFIRSNVSIGNGVWKSTDAGDSWTHMGLEGTGRISRIIVHPTNPDIVYAAAIGHGYAPQPERGIYRTMDGGATWEHVLYVDEETGASDLVMDPNNPRILFAGTWQIAIRTWTRTSGGPGSAIHVSRDGGTTWTRLAGNGLPTREIGKIALCMSRADSRRIYALIETGDGVPWEGGDTDGGELWRSDDGGRNWALVSYDRDLAGRTAYYTRCEINPDDPDEAYFLAAAYSTTLDGGVTSSAAGFLQGPTWDNHDMWIDPYDGDRQIVGGDGGLAISGNRGRTWFRAQLPIAQMYHVTVDNAIPYNVMGNRQDGPSTRGPSNSRIGGLFGVAIPRGLWHSVGGGESGFATPDPTDPNIVWSSASGVGAGGGIV